MKIGFYRSALIGDNIVAIDAIYAIKFLYPNAKLIVFTNDIGVGLYKNFDFIDEIVDMGLYKEASLIEKINSYNFEYFLLTQPNRSKCSLIAKTNIKKTITFLSAGSIFKFQTIFMPKHFNKTPHHKRLLLLVREINKAHFDATKIDFSKTKLVIDEDAKENAKLFLEGLPKNKNVMINPFSRTCANNLTLNGYIKLIKLLAKKHKNINFIIPTYESNPEELPNLDLENVFIFKNNLNIHNLIALISKMDLLITPSTGNAHIANNLGVHIIGLYAKIDTILWRGRDKEKMDFIILKQKRKDIKEEQEDKIITEVEQKFLSLLGQNKI